MEFEIQIRERAKIVRLEEDVYRSMEVPAKKAKFPAKPAGRPSAFARPSPSSRSKKTMNQHMAMG